MPQGLSIYGRKLLADKAALVASLDVPLLVWEAPGGKPEEVMLLATQASNRTTRPRQGEPLVFELRKSNSKHNAFAMGLTVGRTDANDVMLEDNSVSRFHAYFQRDAKADTWKVVDAESKNGSWLGPLKLKPNAAELVVDQAQLRFGDIEVVFFTPKSFMKYLEKKMNE